MFNDEQNHIFKSVFDILFEENMTFNCVVTSNGGSYIIVECEEHQYDLVRETILESYNYDIQKEEY